MKARVHGSAWWHDWEPRGQTAEHVCANMLRINLTSLWKRQLKVLWHFSSSQVWCVYFSFSGAERCYLADMSSRGSFGSSMLCEFPQTLHFVWLSVTLCTWGGGVTRSANCPRCLCVLCPVQTINDDLNASMATADELSKEFNSMLKEASSDNNNIESQVCTHTHTHTDTHTKAHTHTAAQLHTCRPGFPPSRS